MINLIFAFEKNGILTNLGIFDRACLLQLLAICDDFRAISIKIKKKMADECKYYLIEYLKSLLKLYFRKLELKFLPVYDFIKA